MNKPGITMVVLAACALAGWLTVAGADGVQTLRGADVATADQAPAEKPVTGKRPGRQQPIERGFDGQPPLIPHAVENFDEITSADNQCLSCHGLDVFEKKQAPRVGDSHLGMGDGGAPQVVDNARWFCTQCHVPQHDAPPLVENDFEGQRTPAGAAR
ncbi:MAG: nitrate reductase cytochrome c-type subunit [Gammaproteobacteria bacterium]|nr:nitrate reductase cytochrome c-type subunit [Gammaproteobacteria bacterium]